MYGQRSLLRHTLFWSSLEARLLFSTGLSPSCISVICSRSRESLIMAIHSKLPYILPSFVEYFSSSTCSCLCARRVFSTSPFPCKTSSSSSSLSLYTLIVSDAVALTLGAAQWSQNMHFERLLRVFYVRNWRSSTEADDRDAVNWCKALLNDFCASSYCAIWALDIESTFSSRISHAAVNHSLRLLAEPFRTLFIVSGGEGGSRRSRRPVWAWMNVNDGL